MKIKPLASAIVILFAFAAPSHLARADWVNDFYNAAGAGINVTSAGVYEGQAGGALSLGGFSMRVPPRNLQLFGVTPPGLKMGCGGIDFWAGSFGFINKDQFVALARNIGQNAVSYFFQLALKTMAPEIEGTIAYLQGLAQKMNEFNMNTCSAKDGLFGATAASKVSDSFEQRVNNFEAGMGAVSDRFIAMAKNLGSLSNQVGGMAIAKAASPNLGKNDGGKQITIDGPTNVLVKALSTGNHGLSKEEIELLQSLIGSVILTPVPDGADGGKWTSKLIKPTVELKAFIGNRNNPVEVYQIQECDTVPGCLTVTETANFSPGFAYLVKKNLLKIRAQIIAKGSQDPVALDVLQYSSEPIYRLLAITAKPERELLATSFIDTYADATAIDLVAAYIRSVLFEVDRLTRAQELVMVQGEAAYAAALTKRIELLSSQVSQMRAEKQAELTARASNIALVRNLEAAMFNGMTPELRANLAFNTSK